MPTQAPEQSGTNIRTLSMPKSGMGRVTLVPGQQLEFSFNPEAATFTRSGSDLVISGDNGAGLTLAGFFVAENADSLPTFVLPGGDSVPAAGYLQSLNIDISTAAGPQAAPSSGGEGEYDDGAGSLVGGLDRLGSLGTDQWSRSTSVAEAVNADRIATAGLSAVDGGTGDIPNPPDLLVFDARAVLYMQNESGEPYSDRGVTVQALTKNNGQWEAAGQDALDIQALPGNTLDVDALIERVEDGNGNITFRLTAAGKAWMDDHAGQDIVGYYAVTDANGYMYTLQVVISADERFDSSSEHNGHVSPLGLIHGEWHDGKDLSHETGYKTISSNLDDQLTFSGMVTGADIKTGYAADSDDWGKDTVIVNGSVNTTLKGTSTPIYTDAGDPSLQTGTRTVHNEKNGDNVIETGREGSVSINYTAKAGDGSGAAVRAVAAEDGTTYNRGYEPGFSAHVTDETYSYSNTITSGGITIKADGGDAGSVAGVYGTGVAGQEGGNTLTALNGDIDITATSTQNRGEALGVGSRDADSILTASRDVSIEAKAAGGQGSATAVSWITSSDAAHMDKEYSIKAGRDVNLTATNGYGAGGLIIDGSHYYGAEHGAGDPNNPQALVEAGNNVNITAVSHGGTGNLVGAVGVDAHLTGGVTTVVRAVEGNITIDAQASSGGARGVSNIGYGGYTSLFLEAENGTVDITAKNNGSQFGKVTGLVTAGGDSFVDIDDNRTCDANTTSVTAKTINVSAADRSGLSEAAALTASGGRNELSATGDGQNLFSATGGRVGYGLFAQGTEGGPGHYRGGIPGAHGSEGVNSITTLNGEVRVEASGNTAYGTYARGGNAGLDGWVSPDTLVGGTGGEASNNITAKNVDIAVAAANTAYGLYAQGGSSAFGSGQGGGATTTVTATEAVIITATGKVGVGVLADSNATVDITGHDVTVTGTGQTGNAASGGLRATNSAEIAIHSTGGTVRVDTSGAEAYAMNAAGKGKNLIEGAKTVLLNAGHDVMSSTAGTNIIDGAAVDDDEARLNGNIGMWASGRSGTTRSLNQIIDVDRVIIGSDGKTVTGGMCSAGDGTNRIDNATYVEINAGSDGMSANTWGSDASTAPAHNIIQGNGDMDVKMTVTAAAGQAVARGMGTNHTSNAWANRNDILGANEVDITVSGAKKNYAMFSGGGDGNFIEAKGVDITARGGAGSENYGLFAGLSSSGVPGNAGNSIKAERVDILAEGGAGVYGMYAAYGKNTVDAGDGNVSVTARNATEAYAVYAGVNGGNLIAAKDATVTASGNKAGGVVAKGTDASNSIHGDTSLSVTAEGVKLAQGVTAQGAGALSELSSPVRMDITAKTTGPGAGSSTGGEGAMGLYAADGGKVTAETTDLHVTAATTGEQWAAGARADNGGHVELAGGTIAVRAEVNAVNRSGAFAVRAAALETNKGDITVNMTGDGGNTLLLEAENKLQTGNAGGNDFAAGICAEGASNVLIKGDKNATNTIAFTTVSGAGASAGVYTLGQHADVTVLGGDNVDVITINAASNTGMAMGIHVSRDTSDVRVDTGTGDDIVTIRAHSSATSDSAISHAYGLDNAGGTITLKAVEGAVDIGTFSNKSNSYAMSAAGLTAVNSVEAVRVDLKAEGDGGISIGMHGQRGAANRVAAQENVTIEAEGRMAHGLYAEAGAANAITAKAVDISATGTKTTHNTTSDRSTGLNAVGSGSSNTVSALEDVTITATDVTAHGLYAETGGANSVAARTVDISATGSRDKVQSLQERSTGLIATGSGASNTVSASENVTITTDAQFCHSVHASGAGAANTVRAGGALSITATAADGNAYGVAAEKSGTNTLAGADVDITIQAKHSAHGMNAQEGGTNVIHSGSGVDITADGRIVRVLSATDGGRNEISAETDVVIDGDCRSWGRVGAAAGIRGESGGSNAVTAGGDVEISAWGGESAIGMHYLGSAGAHGVNRISAKGDVRITTGDAFLLDIGMMAKDFGGNEICDANSVTIEVGSRESAWKSLAMYAYGEKITGEVGAFNSIHDVAGAVTLIAKNGSARPEASDSGTAGMMAYSGGKNSIFNAGSVDIQVKGSLLDGGGYGMKACGSTSQVSQEMNHIHDITGKVSMEITDSTPAHGMYASDSGTNLIENTGGVEITSKGFLHSYAMYAAGGGLNTITNNNGNALFVVIKATGGSLSNYAMYADAGGTNRIIGAGGNDVVSLQGDIFAGSGGQNILNTGAGDDRIQLDGKVSGDFHLDAGDGYDILVLRAASWSQFTLRYQTWLTANFETMNIESIQWALSNPAGSVPAWLQDLVNTYNAGHSDAPIDFSQAAATDLAHIVAGDVGNLIEHAGDASAAHTAQRADDGDGLAVFGDGDDYVHIKGNVDHVDFILGDGHNSLHVDGNALSHIAGGDTGNDIRVGGSFGGGIDLGSGDDRVELGALHDGGILLGAGDDHLVLHGFTGGTVDGGTGNDTLQLKLDGQGGNNAFAEGGAFGGLFAQGAVRNFEELHFDLSGGSSDSLDVDGLVDSLRGLTIGRQLIVRISGDAEVDHVDTQALAAGGWTSHVDPNTGYTEWTNTNAQDENLVILIQNGLR